MSVMLIAVALAAAVVAAVAVVAEARLVARKLSAPRVVRLAGLTPVLPLVLLLPIEELVTEELVAGTMVPRSASRLLPGPTRSSINVDWHRQLTIWILIGFVVALVVSTI